MEILNNLIEAIDGHHGLSETLNRQTVLKRLQAVKEEIDKQFSIQRVSGSCPIEAIMHYDKLIKTKLERTFEPLRDHGTHAEFCDKINDLREEAKSNYR
jgi:hypothetical protein